eukprot:scaffold5198_cov247-Pinguiococcus_pyrenoidosus.AAC.2
MPQALAAIRRSLHLTQCCARRSPLRSEEIRLEDERLDVSLAAKHDAVLLHESLDSMSMALVTAAANGARDVKAKVTSSCTCKTSRRICIARLGPKAPSTMT